MEKNKLKRYKDPFGDWLNETFEGLGKELDNFGKGLNNFLEQPYYPYYKTAKSVGRVNLMDEGDQYKIEVAAPGFTKEELDVDLDKGILTIKGEHAGEKADESKGYTRREFCKNSFSRSFTVPENITGEVDAKLENGILTMGLKKKEMPPKVEPKKIEIK